MKRLPALALLLVLVLCMAPHAAYADAADAAQGSEAAPVPEAAPEPEPGAEGLPEPSAPDAVESPDEALALAASPAALAPAADPSPTASIPLADANLRQAVAEQLDEQGIGYTLDATTGSIVMDAADVQRVTSLSLPNKNIASLAGLEAFTELARIDAPHNRIASIDGLGTLPKLERLDLYDNVLHDFSALDGCTSLAYLDLGENNEVAHGALAGLDAIAGLTGLTYLDFSENYAPGIADTVSGLTSLEFLNLQQNALTDISGLANLTKLRTLILSHNRITGIAALLGAEPGKQFTQLEELNLQSNNLYGNAAAADNSGIDGLIGADGTLALPGLKKLDIWDNWNWEGLIGRTSKANTDLLYARFKAGNLELGYSYDRIKGLDATAFLHTDAVGTRYTTYDDFGTYRDGVRDDYNAIRNAHRFANLNGCEVRATPGAPYHIFRLWDLQYNNACTDIDWQGATFVIHDEQIDGKGARYTPLLCLRPSPAGSTEATSTYKRIVTLNDPGWTVSKQTTSLAAELASTLASLNAAGYSRYYVMVYDANTKHYVRFGMNANSGTAMWDGFIVGADGKLENPGSIQWDFAQVTKAVITPIPAKQSHVRNATFVQLPVASRTEAPYGRGSGKPIYYLRNLQFQYSANYLVSGIHHIVGTLAGGDGATPVGEDFDAPSGSYSGFFDIRESADVEVRDCSAWARKYAQDGRSTYGLTLNTTVKIDFTNFNNSNTWDQMLDPMRWGIMGTNHTKHVTFDSCTLNRIDAHEGTYDLAVRDCTLGSWGFRLTGQGPLLIERTSVTADTFIMLRGDYGSTWDGTASIVDCTHYVKGTWSQALVSFTPAWEGAGYSSVHDFGYDLRFPNLQVKNLTVDYSRYDKANSQNGVVNDTYIIVPNHTYNHAHEYPADYWPESVDVEGIDFANYAETLGYKPHLRLMSAEAGTAMGKRAGYAASDVAFEGVRTDVSAATGEQLLLEDDAPLSIVSGSTNAFSLTSEKLAGRDIAIEFTGDIPGMAFMDARWKGWSSVSAYYITDAGADGHRTAYFSALEVGTRWSATNGGNDAVGPFTRLRVTTPAATTLHRIALLGADSDPVDVDLPRKALYSREVTLPAKTGEVDDAGNDKYTNYGFDLAFAPEQLEGREIQVRFKGKAPALNFVQVTDGKYLYWANVEPDRVTSADAGGWKVARYKAADILAAWRDGAVPLNDAKDTSGNIVAEKGAFDRFRVLARDGAACAFDRVWLVGALPEPPEHGLVAGKTADEVVRDMQVGWNLGNALECYEKDAAGNALSQVASYPDVEIERYWSNPSTTAAMISFIKDAGFSAVRIPVGWFQHTYDDGRDPSDPTSVYHIDEAWMARVHEVVDYCYGQGLYVVLDTHHDRLWLETPRFGDAGAHREMLAQRLGAIWKQIAAEFADYDQRLVFEGLNEPRASSEGSDAEQVSWAREWGLGQEPGDIETLNALYKAFVDAVRSVDSSYRDTRILLLPTYAGTTGLKMLSQLELPYPGDSHLAMSAHPYEPWAFTEATGQWQDHEFGTVNQVALERVLYRLYATFTSKGIPVAITEFSAADFGNTAERVKWAEFYVSLARSYGITCFLWDGGSLEPADGHDAPAYLDRRRLAWANERQQAVVEAILGAAKGEGAEAGWKSGFDTPVPVADAPEGRVIYAIADPVSFAGKSACQAKVSWADFGAGNIVAVFEGAAPSLVLMDGDFKGWTVVEPSYVAWNAGTTAGVAHFWAGHVERLWMNGTSAAAEEGAEPVAHTMGNLRYLQLRSDDPTSVSRFLQVEAGGSGGSGGGSGDPDGPDDPDGPGGQDDPDDPDGPDGPGGQDGPDDPDDPDGPGDPDDPDKPGADRVAYEIVLNPDGAWRRGSAEGHVFSSSADFSKFLDVLVDGAVLDPAHYTAVSGSTKVTLHADYLSTLAAGVHRAVIRSNDGEAATTFTIMAADAPSPEEPTVADEPAVTDGEGYDAEKAHARDSHVPATGDHMPFALITVAVLSFVVSHITRKMLQVAP